jgi:hypothetical protein
LDITTIDLFCCWAIHLMLYVNYKYARERYIHTADMFEAQYESVVLVSLFAFLRCLLIGHCQICFENQF